jgi:hypothetical protein
MYLHPFYIFLKVEHGFYVGTAIEFISECDIERHFRCAYFCATFTNVEAKNSTRQLKCKIQRIARIKWQRVDIWNKDRTSVYVLYTSVMDVSSNNHYKS